MQNPVTRLVLRAVFAGLVTGLSYLQAALPGIDAGEALGAAVAALVAGGGLAGLELGTPLNQLVGRKPSS